MSNPIESIVREVGNMINYLEIAKECLPQGLVNKTVDDNKSKT